MTIFGNIPSKHPEPCETPNGKISLNSEKSHSSLVLISVLQNIYHTTHIHSRNIQILHVNKEINNHSYRLDDKLGPNPIND